MKNKQKQMKAKQRSQRQEVRRLKRSGWNVATNETKTNLF